MNARSNRSRSTRSNNRLWTLGLLAIAGFFMLSAATVAHGQPVWGQPAPRGQTPRFEMTAPKQPSPWEDGLKYGAIGAVVGLVVSNQYKKKAAATPAPVGPATAQP